MRAIKEYEHRKHQFRMRYKIPMAPQIVAIENITHLCSQQVIAQCSLCDDPIIDHNDMIIAYSKCKHVFHSLCWILYYKDIPNVDISHIHCTICRYPAICTKQQFESIQHERTLHLLYQRRYIPQDEWHIINKMEKEITRKIEHKFNHQNTHYLLH